jgi:hypothetical protein
MEERRPKQQVIWLCLGRCAFTATWLVVPNVVIEPVITPERQKE